jgi:hypothetical protein
MSETMTISVKEYRELRKASAKLELLEGGGVDNWEWYGASLFEGEQTLAQREKEIDAEIDMRIA